MFQNVKEKNNNYFINPSCFVYDKSERLINKSCNLYQILGEIIGILRNACTLSTENRHKTLHGFGSGYNFYIFHWYIFIYHCSAYDWMITRTKIIHYGRSNGCGTNIQPTLVYKTIVILIVILLNSQLWINEFQNTC